jgi:ATP-dependent DNA helicase RecG
LKRKDTTNIPLQAARELPANAVVHADYSQQGAPIRVAIYNLTPAGPVTRDEVIRPF